MKKMLHLMENTTGYNSFREVQQYELVAGNQQDLYFRIIQKESDAQPGATSLRWIPGAAATLTFTFESIDAANVITRVGTMAFPTEDRSIFKVTILPGDKLSGALKAVLTDGANSETILLDGRLVVSSTTDSRFFC